MKKKDSFITKLFQSFGMTNSLTDAEKLENFIKDQRHITLLERIKAIRNNSYFVPDYNKPKAYIDVVILCDEKPISDKLVKTCERPEDFGNDIKAWKKFMNRDHKRATTPKALKEKDEKFQEMMRSKYIKLQPFFNRMMRVE